MTSYREYFDLDPRLIYLNSGTLSISPRRVFKAMVDYQRQYELNPTQSLMETWQMLWERQILLAGFLRCDPKDLFLRPNITHVLNDLILPLSLETGSEILMTDLEYGAIVNTVRFKALRDKLTVKTVALPLGNEPEANQPDKLIQSIVQEMGTQTRMLLVSHGTTANGLVLPIEQLAGETRKRGIYLVVDGAHAPGALALDFRDFEDVDYYAGNLHKWMLGPKGTSFGWIAKRHQETIFPTQACWTTFETPIPFREFGEGSEFATRFLHTGCTNFAPPFALKETFEFWDELGADAIRNQISILQDTVLEEVEKELGWPCLSPTQGPLGSSIRGPLLTFDPPEKLKVMGFELMDVLSKQYQLQLLTAPVKGITRIRFSPHIYNTQDEIRRAVKILKSIS